MSDFLFYWDDNGHNYSDVELVDEGIRDALQSAAIGDINIDEKITLLNI